MSYHHFTIEERCCLREYYKKGLIYRKIAELLGKNVSEESITSVNLYASATKAFTNARKADIEKLIWR